MNNTVLVMKQCDFGEKMHGLAGQMGVLGRQPAVDRITDTSLAGVRVHGRRHHTNSAILLPTLDVHGELTWPHTTACNQRAAVNALWQAITAFMLH